MRGRYEGFLAVAALAATTPACSLVLDWDGLSSDTSVPAGGGGGGAGGEGASGGHANGGAGGGVCAGAPGPAMVEVGSFCIDSTEVTKAQYQTFLDAAPSLANQPAGCDFNTTFEPADWPISAGQDNYPVAFVDWCDAAAFCAWAGKALCGHIDGGGVPLADIHNPDVAQWFRACTRNGTRTYPYGTSFEPFCNAGDSGTNAAVPVGEHDQCVGGYEGIVDMVGNVAEWEETCTPRLGGLTDPCVIRGDDYDTIGSASCTESLGAERWTREPYIGFRCCAPLF